MITLINPTKKKAPKSSKSLGRPIRQNQMPSVTAMDQTDNEPSGEAAADLEAGSYSDQKAAHGQSN